MLDLRQDRIQRGVLGSVDGIELLCDPVGIDELHSWLPRRNGVVVLASTAPDEQQFSANEMRIDMVTRF